MSTANSLHAGFRKPEMLHLAGLNQFLDRTGNVLDGYLRVDAVLIEQVDDVGSQALQRALDGRLDVLRPAIQDLLFAVVTEREAELGRDYHPVANGCQCLANDFLI